MAALQKVAWIGLGNMGSPLAGRVAQYVKSQGASLSVFDLAEQARARFVSAEGGVNAASVADACEGADAVFICLPTSAHSQQAALEADAVLKSGARVVDVTSGDPEVSKAIAASLQRSAYVDLAVSVHVHGLKHVTPTIAHANLKLLTRHFPGAVTIDACE